MRLLNGLITVSLLTCVAMAQDATPAKTTIPILIQNSHHQPAINITRESLAINQHKTIVTEFSFCENL
jgi:hypothetical protein